MYVYIILYFRFFILFLFMKNFKFFLLINLGISSNLNSIEYIRLFFNGNILYLELKFEYFRI